MAAFGKKSGNAFIELEMDQKELQKLTKALAQYPEECKKGLVAAVNKSVSTTNTALQKNITERYNIKKGDLSGGSKFKGSGSNNLIKVNKASAANLGASIVVRGSRIALVTARGMVTPKAPKSHKGKTMKQIKRLAPPRVRVVKSQKKSYPHGFVIQGKGGTVGLFSRKKGGKKLEMQRTLSVANMAKHKTIEQETKRTMDQALKENTEHEIAWRLEKLST